MRTCLFSAACLLSAGLTACDARVGGPNLPPVAVAGPDRSVVVGRMTELDGAASYDPDGEALTFHWTLLVAPSGSQAGLTAREGQLSGLSPDCTGIYLVALQVRDGRLASRRDVLRVTALSGCEEDSQCNDADDCTRDRCVWGECFNEVIAGCEDLCPEDPDKLEPGVCGCGIPETDADGDGVPDCADLCPDDPAKSDPGFCGCHNPETDGDGDGTPDCQDGCPQDPAKTEAGYCGCGNAEIDTDGDGALDCLEECPDDPDKLGPGVCGCGYPDVDSDGDGLLDCQDPCPQDVTGDTDGDGHCDSQDCAPLNPHAHENAPDVCNGIDDDCNGVVDDGLCRIGCSDGEREGFVDPANYPAIAGCSGGWSEPGVLDSRYPLCGNTAGDDSPNPEGAGCSLADLCQPGWRVCASSADVAASSPSGCGGAVQTGDPQLFFVTRQSGNGSAECGEIGANDLFGCGNLGASADASCDPLDMSSGNLCDSLGSPWECGSNTADEANQVTKAAAEGGGVLCCRTEVDCSSDPDGDGDGIPDGCDPCPADSENDVDGDGFCAGVDTCPALYNPGQIDSDADGQGDLCDDDDDDDQYPDPDDCAPFDPDSFPGAPERCNGIDDDCDGRIDNGACPCEVEIREGHAYQFCAGPLPWVEARTACYQYGYTLASIEDQSEDAWLWSTILTWLGDEHVWHGFNDRTAEGFWAWENGSTSLHTNWAAGEPNDSGVFTGEDCGTWQAGAGGQWNDQDCNDAYAYVCESGCGGGPDSDGDGWADDCDCAPFNPTAFPGAPEVCNAKDDDCDGQIEPASACPCPVDDYNGHRYLYCGSSVDWLTARSECKRIGFSLLTVETSTEGSYVRGRITNLIGSQSVWLGLNDRLSEGVWIWENGALESYTMWWTGEPNDAGGAEDCALIEYANSYWNDVNCQRFFPYVCESEPCPNDPDNDIDGDGVCGNMDTCPTIYNPGQIEPCW